MPLILESPKAIVKSCEISYGRDQFTEVQLVLIIPEYGGSGEFTKRISENPMLDLGSLFDSNEMKTAIANVITQKIRQISITDD